MARAFAQHADAGQYHVEIRYVDGAPKPWESMVFQKKKTSCAIFSGQSDDLEDAKKSASASIGLSAAQWTSIGPPIELPD
jgi:hypothetical protein